MTDQLDQMQGELTDLERDVDEAKLAIGILLRANASLQRQLQQANAPQCEHQAIITELRQVTTKQLTEIKQLKDLFCPAGCKCEGCMNPLNRFN